MKRFSALGLIIFGLCACQQDIHDVKETSFLLGTIVEFTIYTDKEDLALKSIAEASNAMRQVEDTFTTFGDVENSVKQFNRAAVGEVVALNPEVEKLLVQSLQINKQTEGAFDPTLGALNSLWGFSGYELAPKPPTRDAIESALNQSGIAYIKRNHNGWLKKKPGLQLDFGAIAKGYAIDKGISVLKKNGFSQAIINAGGDMRVLGSHGHQPWRIAIRHPRNEQPLGWLEVSQDASIVTSGDYERFYMYENQRYHHILNPKTGYPSTMSQSMTVIAENATMADAWSTGLFVLGYQQGDSLVERQSGIQALWVTDAGQIKQTSNITLHH